MTSPITRRAALRCAALLPAAGLAATLAARGAGPARAEGLQLIDFADRLVSPEQIKAAGFAGALVYVSQLRPGATFDFKPVTRDYADGLAAAGLQIVSCYQYGKPGWVNSPSDFTRGFDGGVADARTALGLHGGAGGPDTAPIFFSVDDDINRHTWDTVALQWFRGINSVLGVQRTGIYGGVNTCQWAADDGVIGASSTPGKRWAWQTRSWSRGKVYPGAVLYQRIVSTAANPGPRVGGQEVDVSDALAGDCGQWNLHP